MVVFDKRHFLQIWEQIGRPRTAPPADRPLRILFLEPLVATSEFAELVPSLQVFAPGTVEGLFAADFDGSDQQLLSQRDTHCVATFHDDVSEQATYERMLRRADLAVVLTEDLDHHPHIISLYAARIPTLFGDCSIGARMMEDAVTGLAFDPAHRENFVVALRAVLADRSRLEVLSANLERLAAGRQEVLA